jgi:hypothetical protein
MNETIRDQIVAWGNWGALPDIHPQTPERLVSGLQEMSIALASSCDTSILTPSNIAAAVTQYLWQLSRPAEKWLTAHTPTYQLVENEYIGFQIRLTDKKGEMGDEAWNVLSDNSALVDLALPHAIRLNISTIFIATDDCHAFESLRKEFRSRKATAHFVVVGACLESEEGKDVSDFSAHSNGGAMHLIQDLETLSKAALIIGTLYSNIFRIAYRLRYPDHRFVNVADEFFTLNKNSMSENGYCWHYPGAAPGSTPC